MRTGDRYQAYLCHRAHHLRFAQKTDGAALAEGNREALPPRGGHSLGSSGALHLSPLSLLQQTCDLSCGARLALISLPVCVSLAAQRKPAHYWRKQPQGQRPQQPLRLESKSGKAATQPREQLAERCLRRTGTCSRFSGV